MNFFLNMIPPTVTAQTRRVAVQNGKIMFYKSKRLKDARALFVEALKPEAPEVPMEGAVALTVTWKFLTKSHKEGEWRITRPDTDNLQKLLKDCMTEVGYWKDDSQVCVEIISKVWSRETPGIDIKVEEL